MIGYTPVVGVLIAAAIALASIRLLRRVLHRGLERLDTTPDKRAALRVRVERLTGALTFLTVGIVAVAAISLSLERFNIAEPTWRARDIAHGLMTHGVFIVLVVIGAVVVVRGASLAIEHLQQSLGHGHAEIDLEWERRARTLSSILTRGVTAAVAFITILMILMELGINVVPLLTSVGIVGLAIGFGAQNLVRDIISGFFLIVENQVRIGDQARINNVSGVVEEINLRTIVLRDGEGAVQVFPNGTITALANLSKTFSFAVVDVRIGYAENLDRVFEIMREVGAGMQADPQWKPHLLAPLEVNGVESLADGYATVRMRFKTLPLHQGGVANELRRRLLAAFVAKRIEPFG